MNGKWITCPDPKVETLLFEKTFNLEQLPKKAEIDITGLGYFTLLVNGKTVTEDIFTPAQTDYAPRPVKNIILGFGEEGHHRVLYLTYDILSALKEGENKIEIILGNGYWRQKLRICEGKQHYSDYLITCFDIKLDDKIISSDGSEKAYRYPILRSNLYYGEIVDMRMFQKNLEEVAVSLSDFEPERLFPQDCDPDRVLGTIRPKLIEGKGKYLYDCGVNITGWAVIKAKGKSGDIVNIEFAEEVEDGVLNHETYSGFWCVSADGERQLQKDSFTLADGENLLKPMFVYHGFRYFEIFADEGVEILDVEVEVAHTDLKVVTEFECDNEVINWLYNAFIRTQLNNVHGSVPFDCPTRERLGYTGDGQLCTPPTSRVFDAKRFYKKWINDIIDCQDSVSGRIQNTAPFMGGGGGHGGWGSAIVFVPYYCYMTYGDSSFLEMAYPAMKNWLKYMQSHCVDGILSSIESCMRWNLGDWCVPEGAKLSRAYVNSCSMVKQLEYMEEISNILGEKDAERFAEIRQKVANAIYERYYEEGHYCYDADGADAFAYWAKLPKTEEMLASIAETYDRLAHFNTGIIGTYVLIEVLFQKAEYAKIAVKLLAGRYPDHSFGGMMDRNQTTLGEYFDDRMSHDHPMFGSVVAYLFKGLLGMQDNVDMKKPIRFAPCLDSVVKKASGSMITIGGGRAAISFCVGEKTVIDITVPEGRLAELVYGDNVYALNAGENHFEF